MIMSQKAKVHSTIQRFSNGDNDRKRLTPQQERTHAETR